MGARSYFKKQFKLQMLSLEHDDLSEFYLSCWQTGRSALPLLLVRVLLFLTCLGIMLTSMIMISMVMEFQYWFVYMTHWGVLLNTLSTGSAVFVSVKAYSQGSLDSSLDTPWYVKLHWALAEIATGVAFFITLFYWSFLTGIELEVEVDYGFNPVLDVLVHAVNSALMAAALLCARAPARLLHAWLPLCAGIVYLAFSLIYYYAGGTDPLGNRWIYPMLDWSQPGMTSIAVVGSALGIVIIHILTVLLAWARDALSRRVRKEHTLSISEY